MRSNGMMATLTSPGCFAAACSVLSRLCEAVLSAASLPLEAIDPVLSSTRASSSFLIPHSTSVVTDTVVDVPPITRETVASTVAVAETVRTKLPCCGLDSTELTCRSLASGRVNCALK
jgi:hypothetical protein